MGLIIKPRTSLTVPVNAPATGPKSIPLMITGISPKPMRRAGNPAIGIVYEKTLVRIMLIPASSPQETMFFVL